MSAAPPTTTEPVAVAELVRVVLGLVVGAGWLAAPDAEAVMAVVTGLAVVVSAAASWWTRRRVTPAARPRADDAPPPLT